MSRGRLCVAVASTVNYFASRLLAAFHKRYPNIGLRLDVTERKRLVQQLKADSVDLVLMGQPPEAVDVESDAFMENPMAVIAPHGHPLEFATVCTRYANDPRRGNQAGRAGGAWFERRLGAHGRARARNGGLVILDIEGFPLERQWYLVYRRSRRFS